MKKLFLLIMFSHIVFTIEAQWWKTQHHIYDTVGYVVMYELKFKQDSTNLNWQRVEEHMLSIGKNNNVSSFRSYSSYRQDMELKKAGDNGTSSELIETGHIGQLYKGISPSAFQFDIFKDYSKRIVTTHDHIYLQGGYEYEEPFDSFKWQITSETDTIHNYVCQKAICDFGGRTWEAWFTMEIPISDGPYKFCGLPGLILNIADTQTHYSWKFLSIENPSEPMMVYEVIKDRTTTTKEDFFKLQKRYKVSHSVSDASLNNDKMIQRTIEYEKSKNNPIELDSY